MIFSEPPPVLYEYCVRRLDGHAEEDEDDYGNYIGDNLIHNSHGFCTKGLSKQELWDLLNEN